jgi:catechol 2,3-dioxygenase-like lactoylglutathione lyase family enzyme
MRIVGFHHLQLAAPVGSEPAATAFYGKLLGLRQVPKPPHLAVRGGVWFQVGAQQLHVGVETGFQPAHKAHPAFHVEELEVLRQRLTEAGYPVTDGDPLAGYRRFYSVDPFGNRLEFIEPDAAGEKLDGGEPRAVNSRAPRVPPPSGAAPRPGGRPAPRAPAPR